MPEEPWRMKKLIDYAIDYYHLEGSGVPSSDREAFKKRILREIDELNESSVAAGKGERIRKDRGGYALSSDEAQFLVQIRLYGYFIQRAPEERKQELSVVQNARDEAAYLRAHGELLEPVHEQDDDALRPSPVSRTEMAVAELKAMLLLIIEKLYEDETFDTETFERDYGRLQELYDVIDPRDTEPRTVTALLDDKLRHPRNYLVRRN